ncbi:MAG: hypothetical protein DMF77_23860, partial [Acidobacteria bacterium]
MALRRIRPMAWPLLALPLLALPFTVRSAVPAGPRFAVQVAPGLAAGPLDGRLLLLVSKDESQEPRLQIEDGPKSQQAFGIDVDGWAPGTAARFEPGVLGYPLESLRDLPAGTYTVQALLHKYETFHRSDGHTVKTPRKVTVDPAATAAVEITLDQTIPPIPDPPTTRYVRHERIQSERLTKFWGRPMSLGANVLVPEGFDAHPEARYPLVINHGHFSQTIDGFREEPPDPNLKPDYSERFHWAGYNRTQQEWAYQLYKDWTSPGYPRMLVVEIQHANPYYDDSYAVNSANLGPYGDAITYELIPYLEKKYRALG